MESNITPEQFSSIQVQCDWEQDVKKIGKSSFWANYFSKEGKKVYGKIHTSVQENGSVSFDSDDGFRVTSFDKKALKMKVEFKEEFSEEIQAPTFQFEKIHSPSVNFLDLSPMGELGTSAGNDGQLYVWETKSGEIRRTLTGHLGDVLCCRFFPSGKVIMSGGSDYRIRIWDAIEGTCATNLTNHSGGILSLAAIDRGRNILSSSRDGTVRLWDCASENSLKILCESTSALNDISIAPLTDSIFHPSSQRSPDPREVGGEGKVLIVAGEDGTVRGIDLQSHVTIFSHYLKFPLNKCQFLGERHFVVGDHEGHLWVFDAAQMSHPLSVSQRSQSPITSLSVGTEGTVWVGTGGGEVFQWNWKEKKTMRDLSGSDCEEITNLSIRSSLLVTSCRDGNIRSYYLD